MTKEDYELIERARDALLHNFDDGVFNHTVGSALRCKNGKVYAGVNCDGIHGSCAEYVCMGMAKSQGEREFDTIVAVNRHGPKFIIPPCGNCRQMLFDYAPDIKVIFLNGGEPVKAEISDLLPFAYRFAGY